MVSWIFANLFQVSTSTFIRVPRGTTMRPSSSSSADVTPPPPPSFSASIDAHRRNPLSFILSSVLFVILSRCYAASSSIFLRCLDFLCFSGRELSRRHPVASLCHAHSEGLLQPCPTPKFGFSVFLWAPIVLKEYRCLLGSCLL